MKTIVENDEEIDSYAASESFANDWVFHRWCEHLFVLNEKLHQHQELDTYYLRAYIITLYELSNNGLFYARQKVEMIPQDDRYRLFNDMIVDIFEELTDDDYLLLKYFRDSSCHIFTHNYNYYDKHGNYRGKKLTYYTKDGTKQHLKVREFIMKAEAILGRVVGGELSFKKQLVEKLSPIICDYEIRFKEAKTKTFIPWSLPGNDTEDNK